MFFSITLFSTNQTKTEHSVSFDKETMEKKTESKEQQWKGPTSFSSSSTSSSITSDSSDGHFDIRHFPLPRPSLSASEAQKQRESHQAYSSSVFSYTGSSWSSVHHNQLADLPGYDPNRIPSSVFSSKPGNSAEWSLASNESLFSIHDVNFSISNAALRSGEIPRFEESVHEINPVPLPPVNKPQESEKETITEKKPYQEEKSVSEIGEHEEEEDVIEAEVLVGIKTEKREEKDVVEDVKENKQEDSNSIVSYSPSISCRSDTSNNSISSFAFPV